MSGAARYRGADAGWVVLLGDHYRPAGDDRPLPVVLVRSPYGRAGMAGLTFVAPMARREFPRCSSRARGERSARAGCSGRSPSEREDRLAAVAWLRDQPWCDGRVSMTEPGASCRALRKVPLQAADVDVAGAPVAFWRDFTGHAGPGDGVLGGCRPRPRGPDPMLLN